MFLDSPTTTWGTWPPKVLWFIVGIVDMQLKNLEHHWFSLSAEYHTIAKKTAMFFTYNKFFQSLNAKVIMSMHKYLLFKIL